jgi:hypothetical protein
MKHLFYAGAMLLGSLISSSANAQSIANRAALNALLGANQTLETFELFTNTDQIASDQTLNSSADWAGQGAGKVAAGVNYTAGGGYMFLNTDGYYGLSSHTLGDAAGGRALDLAYTAPVTAFGLDLQGYAGYSGSGLISVYDTAGVLLSATNVQAGYDGASSFFGWQNAGGIGRVVIAAGGNGYIMIDNHGYGANAIAAVPEPATWALMIVGFGFVGAAVRRERKVTARVSYAA